MATFSSNRFVTAIINSSDFVSNNYLQEQTQSLASNNYIQDIFVSNNYLEDIKTTFGMGYVDGRFTSNNYIGDNFTSNTFLVATFASNNYVQDHVATEVAAIVNSAPATLDTLNELAAALGDDSNFSTTVSNQIGLRATNTYVNSTFTSNNYLQGLGFTTNVGDVANAYLIATFSSNNYLQDQLDFKATNTYVNSTFTSNSYVDGRFTSNNFVKSIFTSNNYVDAQLGLKLDSSSYTASDVLTKIKTVDGTGSGLDADKLDGLEATAFATSAQGVLADSALQSSDIGVSVQAHATVLDNTTASYTTAEETKLAGIEIGATADQTSAEIKALYELEANAYTDTKDTKLSGIEAGATADQTASEILTAIKTVDGSGSGLDADTLDGLQGSSYVSNNYVDGRFTSNAFLVATFTTNNFIQSYVSSEVASLVDSAPATLDTLNELAAALGDDANFATTVSTQIGIRATNTYVNSTFSSNNYLQGLGYTTNTGDVSNNYLQSLGYTTNTGDVSNNYLQGLGFTTNVGDVTNTYLTATFSSNNYLQGQLGDKLNSSSYTASDVLTKIKTVDGSGSGLDADTLDGLQVTSLTSNNYLQGLGFTTNVGDVANAYLIATFTSNNYIQTQLGTKLNSSSYTASNVLTKIKTVDGTGSGLDADTLDGQEASAFQTVAAPNSPSITSTTVVNETIELVFGQSSTSGVTRYEVWSDGATGSDYSLISIIPSQDAAASMSVVDISFDTGGTVAYRVYAIKNGVYSTAATTTKSFTIPSLDVTNMSVVSSITNYDIQYDLPETRFLDHIEIYKDAETTLVALSRTGAALIYSGSSDNFTYNVPPSDKAKFHQFWVEVVSV